MTTEQQKLVTDNLRLATHIAKRFRGHGVESEDLVAEAQLALVKAALGYNPAGVAKFSTYASCVIERALKRCRRKNYQHDTIPLETVICVDDSGESTRLKDVIGREDPGQGAVEATAVVATLPELERQVTTLVIIKGVKQADAASKLGMSQAVVSHILKDACTRLRDNL